MVTYDLSFDGNVRYAILRDIQFRRLKLAKLTFMVTQGHC